MLKNKVFKRHFPFVILSISIMFALTLPNLVQDGMFMDAVLYTSVSKNLSLGIGTFWFPKFSQFNVGNLPSFHEQPPLVFGIQSVFFNVFGTGMYVERFYTFLMMCITSVLIVVLWREIFRNNISIKQIFVLPLILWITIPVCFWSYSNNMHENTLGIFTLSAGIFLIKSFNSPQKLVFYSLLAGVFIFLATLSKGVPGFFPLSIPFLYFITTRKISLRIAVIQSFIIFIIPIVFYFILFSFPESKESLSNYIFKRALFRITEEPNESNRFFILQRLFWELFPMLLFTCIAFSISKIKKLQFIEFEQIKLSMFFISVGLSASIPIMLTLIQKGFYLVPSFPFFAVGFSILVSYLISDWIQKINIHSRLFLFVNVFSFALFIGVLVFAYLQMGKTSRDKELLHDIHLIGKYVPNKTLISVPDNVSWNNWQLQTYLMRYYNIGLEVDSVNNYMIIENSEQKIGFPKYKKIEIGTFRFDLYECRE